MGGHTYFECRDKHGILAMPASVYLLAAENEYASLSLNTKSIDDELAASELKAQTVAAQKAKKASELKEQAVAQAVAAQKAKEASELKAQADAAQKAKEASFQQAAQAHPASELGRCFFQLRGNSDFSENDPVNAPEYTANAPEYTAGKSPEYAAGNVPEYAADSNNDGSHFLYGT